MRRLISGGWLGVTNGLLLWSCGHSELKKVADAGVLLWRRVNFLRVGETGGSLASIVNMGVVSEEINGKKCSGTTKWKRNMIHNIYNIYYIYALHKHGCNFCHIRQNFSVVYLTPHYVASIILCKMFHWFINNDLKNL